MKNQAEHTAGMRFVAAFYLVFFTAALFFSGASGLFTSAKPGASVQSRAVFCPQKDSLNSAGVTPVSSSSSPAADGTTESASKSENSDDSGYNFDFKFSSVLQWIFGRIVRYVPLPSAGHAQAYAPIWLQVCNLRI